jgi:myosin heavy subunit
MVTYVSNANNFKEKYTIANKNLRAQREITKNAVKKYEKYTEQKDADFVKANAKITELKTQNETLQRNFDNMSKKNHELTLAMAGMSSSVKAANTTAKAQTDQLEKTLNDLKALEKNHTIQTKDLKETNDTLMEKMAIISTQLKKIKQLTEEKTELQAQLGKFHNQYGKAVQTNPTVSRFSSKARLAPRSAPDIGLNGSITDIDLKNHLVEVSVGTTNGVKEEMKFRVTRGDKYVCDILILEADAEKSVGVLDMIQITPRVGDKIASNL